MDQVLLGYPLEVALDGSAAGVNLCYGHWRGTARVARSALAILRFSRSTVGLLAAMAFLSCNRSELKV